MSKKQPEIKVIYPDASTAAMLLTDATLREAADGEIEPGLLNDIDTETEGEDHVE
jgi:hypothetical protein